MASLPMCDFTVAYSNYNHFQRRIADEVFMDYFNHLKWQRRGYVLDIGCSSGDVTISLLKRLPDISKLVAFDISDEFIKEAKKLNSDPRIEYVIADITQNQTLNPQWQGKFDAVFSMNTLHWVMDQNSALENICWCMKPGGVCFLLLAGRTNPIFMQALKKFMEMPKWKPLLKKEVTDSVKTFIENHMKNEWMHSDNPEKSYAKMMEKAGLCVTVNVLEVKTHECDFEEYKGIIAVTNPLMRGVPETQKSDFLHDFASAMAKETKTSISGKYIIEYPNLIMIGEKLK